MFSHYYPSQESAGRCIHKLIIISELNVISTIQWKSKIVLASTKDDNARGGSPPWEEEEDHWPKISKPRQKSAREGGVEGLLVVAIDRSELPRAMPTGAIERCIVSCANPQQANSQQSTSPEWVTSIHCFCFTTRICNALSCILGMFFFCYQCFFYHDENAIYPKVPIYRL